MKVISGVPLRRPAWFFDIAEYGEGLADVGTHVVDLVQWTAFADQAIDYEKDIRITGARRWPTRITAEQFQQVTGQAGFPEAMQPNVRDGVLEYFCNNDVAYTLHGSHVKLEILWNWEAVPGAGDVYEAAFRGSKARIELRQGVKQKFVPEVYVVPVVLGERAAVYAAARKKLAALSAMWPGVTLDEFGTEARIVIPPKYRVGHEAHFAQVTSRFFDYVKSPKTLPSWERANMLAKYYVTTKGVEISGAGK
jgi:hypothetical protein